MMRKRYLVILMIIILILSIILLFINSPRVIFYINWNIYLPKPQKIDIIYNFEFREGEDLEIWHYNKKVLEKIISNRNFKNIDSENAKFLKEKLKDYYTILKDDNKHLFNINVNADSLLVQENYFLYVSKKDNDLSWMILILDYNNANLYYFSNIY
jgi:hypothetical protein